MLWTLCSIEYSCTHVRTFVCLSYIARVDYWTARQLWKIEIPLNNFTGFISCNRTELRETKSLGESGEPYGIRSHAITLHLLRIINFYFHQWICHAMRYIWYFFNNYRTTFDSSIEVWKFKKIGALQKNVGIWPYTVNNSQNNNLKIWKNY